MRQGRSILPVVLAAILAVGGSVPAVAAGRATPEDAVRDYLAGVAQADVSKILDASAIDEMSAGFRFDLLADRLKAMNLTGSLAPAEYPMFVDMNRAQQAATVLGQVRSLVYSLLSSEQVDGSIIVPADKARADAFIKQVDPSRLSGLAVADIRFPTPRVEHDPTYLANRAKQAAMYGADEIRPSAWHSSASRGRAT